MAASLAIAAVRQSVKDHLARLAAEVDATRRDEGFREALRAMSLFWRYSLFNQWLIGQQRPGATMVNSRGRWLELDRKVKPGERAIEILAPTRRGEVLRFLSVPVFDVRQTRGRKVATLDLALRGGSRHVATLVAAAGQLGVEVAWVAPSPGWAGRSTGGRIEVREGLPGREKVAVLAHELAHEILHQAERRRAETLKRPGPRRTHAERETEADATAYVVLLALGIPSRAPAYIAWQGGTGLAVLRSMTRIQRAARAILEAAEAATLPEARARPPRRRQAAPPRAPPRGPA
jgi:hypothetical protein